MTQEQYIKDELSIWHTKEEKPKQGSKCVWKYTKEQKKNDRGWFDSGRFDSCYDCFCTTPSCFVDREKGSIIEKWAYLDDLLKAYEEHQAILAEIERLKKELETLRGGK